MINTSHHRLCLHPLVISGPQSSTMAERIPSHPHPANASSKAQGASSLGIAEEAAVALPQTGSHLRRQETLQSQNAACLGKAANFLFQPLRSSSLGFSILSYKSHSPKLIHSLCCLHVCSLSSWILSCLEARTRDVISRAFNKSASAL